MTLWKLKTNQSATVKGINHKLPATFRERLEHLGFGIGETVVCVRRTPFNGPAVFRVGDCTFSLAEDIASAVDVEEPSQ